MSFVYSIPHISKPRVTGSNSVGRANNLSIFKILLSLSLYPQVILKFDYLTQKDVSRLDFLKKNI